MRSIIIECFHLILSNLIQAVMLLFKIINRIPQIRKSKQILVRKELKN